MNSETASIFNIDVFVCEVQIINKMLLGIHIERGGSDVDGRNRRMRQRNHFATLSEFISGVVFDQITIDHNHIANGNIGGFVATAAVGLQEDFITFFINHVEGNVTISGVIGCRDSGNDTCGIHFLCSNASINSSAGLGHGVRIVLSARSVGVGCLGHRNVLGDGLVGVVGVGKGNCCHTLSIWINRAGERNSLANCAGGKPFVFCGSGQHATFNTMVDGVFNSTFSGIVGDFHITSSNGRIGRASIHPGDLDFIKIQGSTCGTDANKGIIVCDCKISGSFLNGTNQSASIAAVQIRSSLVSRITTVNI